MSRLNHQKPILEIPRIRGRGDVRSVKQPGHEDCRRLHSPFRASVAIAAIVANVGAATMMAIFSGNCWAQQTGSAPTLSERPSKPFANIVPERTAWTTTVKMPGEKRADPAKSEPVKPVDLGKFASTTVERVENAYSSGVRRETIHYRDGSQFVRYVTHGLVFYEDRRTGAPVMEDAANAAITSTSGVNRRTELDWVTDKYYVGVANYDGTACYVYRQFAPQSLPPTEPGVEPPSSVTGVAATDVEDVTKAPVLGTVWIDKETMQPIAYETIYETRLYGRSVSSPPVALPASLQEVARQYAESVAKEKQRYNIPQ